MSATVILNGDRVYTEELVRENARLIIQHEADHQRILALNDLVKQLEQENGTLSSRAELAEGDLQMVKDGLGREKVLAEKLGQAIQDLHVIMAGGDACAVCKNKCLMGATACEPRWKGLDD